MNLLVPHAGWPSGLGSCAPDPMQGSRQLDLASKCVCGRRGAARGILLAIFSGLGPVTLIKAPVGDAGRLATRHPTQLPAKAPGKAAKAPRVLPMWDTWMEFLSSGLSWPNAGCCDHLRKEQMNHLYHFLSSVTLPFKEMKKNKAGGKCKRIH